MSRIPAPETDLDSTHDSGEAVLAGGCFWCTEAVFQSLAGVRQVTSGYAGGDAETANYRAVCSGGTGHAEAIRVRYEPDRISYAELLRIFFEIAHDPTQVGGQGADRGPQYRSAVFYADPEQQRVARDYIRQLDHAGVFAGPIATSLEPLTAFYDAEDYHQDFVANNPAQPYACMVAAPKVDKLREAYPEKFAPAW